AAVDRIGRVVGVLQLGLAVTDSHEVAVGDVVVRDQVLLDGVGAALGEVLVERIAADAIGMARDHEGRAFQFRIRQRFAEGLYWGHRGGADRGRIVVELDLQIDVRLGRRDLGNLLAFAYRQRTCLAVAQALDEARLPGLDRGIDLRGRRADGKSAG